MGIAALTAFEGRQVNEGGPWSLKVMNGSSGNSGEITASGDEAAVGAVVATVARQCDEWRWQENNRRQCVCCIQCIDKMNR